MTAAAAPLWHITLQVAGEPAIDSQLDKALRRLCDLDPGNMGARYATTTAELQFWDEGADVEQVARAAIDLWQRVRGSGGLPDWPLVGIDVAAHLLWRDQQSRTRRAIAPGSVAPQG